MHEQRRHVVKATGGCKYDISKYLCWHGGVMSSGGEDDVKTIFLVTTLHYIDLIVFLLAFLPICRKPRFPNLILGRAMSPGEANVRLC